MEFDRDKCRTLNIRRGKVELEGFKTGQGDVIEPMNEIDTSVILVYYSVDKFNTIRLRSN
jgi:hypothetical protein